MSTATEPAAAPAPPPWARARRLAMRLGWGVADQGASSLTNFLAGLYVARALGPEGFGAFSLTFATYLLVLAACRGLGAEPLIVRFSAATPAQWRGATARSAGLALALGTAAGAVCLAVAAVLGGPTGAALAVLAVTLPGLLLQDSWRFAFFAAGRGAQAFANDVLWAVVLGGALVVVAASGVEDVAVFVLAWGGSACVAAVAGAVQARVVPRPAQTVAWLREQRDLAFRYLGEELSLSAGTQLRFYGLAAVATVAAVGSLRTAELLLGPFSMVIMGMAMMAAPEAARVLHRSPRHLKPFCLLLGAVGAGGAALWGTVLMVALPGGLGERILGESYAPAADLVLPATITIAMIGATVGATAGLRALGAASRSLRAQLVRSGLYLGLALAGAAVADAPGAAWGSALGGTVGAVAFWWQFRAALRDRAARASAAPTPAAGTPGADLP